MEKILFSLPGGSTAFIMIMKAAIEAVKKGYTPSHIVGVSAGAIGCVPLAMGMFDEIEERGLNLTQNEIFKKNCIGRLLTPINNKGNITVEAIFRLITGKNSLGVQNIRNLLKSVITAEIFEKYKTGNYPPCYIVYTNFENGMVEWSNAKELTYEQYLTDVQKSSRIATYVQPIIENDTWYFDGGHVYINAGALAVEKIVNDKIDRVISFYTQKVNKPLKKREYKKNAVTVFLRQSEVELRGRMKSNFIHEQYACKDKSIILHQIQMDNPTDSLYSTTTEDFNEMYSEAINAVKQQLKPYGAKSTK